MISNRSFIAAAICALALPLAACGGGSEGPGDDEPPPPPTGTHYGYVVSKAYIPASRAQSREYGLDLGAAKSGVPDGTIDNALGDTFVTLATLASLDIQGAVTEAIDQGTIVLLVDVQTADFTTASASGLAVRLGDPAMITPTACVDANDVVCRRHLDGNGTFKIAADSPTDAAVAGPIVGGTFNGGPGDLSLQLALGDAPPIRLDLHNARAKATGISATGMTANVAGALKITDLNNNIFPAIQTLLVGVIEAGCPAPRTPPGCNCTSTTTSTIVGLFDGKTDAEPVANCEVSLQEISNSKMLAPFLTPDICSTATCAEPDALSIGIKIDAVKATFPL